MSRTAYAVLAAQLPRQFPIVSATDGLPFVSNDKTLFARTDALGNVMLMLVGSVCGACIARARPSAFCCAKMVCWSSSLFRVLAKKSPPVTKSVVRWIVRLPTMAIWVAPVGAAVSVIDPVPLALIVTE